MKKVVLNYRAVSSRRKKNRELIEKCTAKDLSKDLLMNIWTTDVCYQEFDPFVYHDETVKRNVIK